MRDSRDTLYGRETEDIYRINVADLLEVLEKEGLRYRFSAGQLDAIIARLKSKIEIEWEEDLIIAIKNYCNDAGIRLRPSIKCSIEPTDSGRWYLIDHDTEINRTFGTLAEIMAYIHDTLK